MNGAPMRLEGKGTFEGVDPSVQEGAHATSADAVASSDSNGSAGSGSLHVRPAGSEAVGDASADSRSLSNEGSSLLERLRDIARSEKRVLEALGGCRSTKSAAPAPSAERVPESLGRRRKGKALVRQNRKVEVAEDLSLRGNRPGDQETRLMQQLYHIVREREAVVNRLREVSVAVTARRDVDRTKVESMFRLISDEIKDLDRSSMDILYTLTADLKKSLEKLEEGRSKSAHGGTGGPPNEPAFVDILC